MSRYKAVWAWFLALVAMLMAGVASADPSLIKFSTTGNGVYDIAQIYEFDWQSSGDIVIVDALPAPAIANGSSVTTFSAWAANAVLGDSVAFNLHFHARLNAMIDTFGGNSAPLTMSLNGATCLAGSGCFEITAAASGMESATLVGPGLLQLDSIVGTYKFFFNAPPDSNVANPSNASPTSFANGVPFLSGSAVAVSGNQTSTNGSSLIDSSIDSYNSNYIAPDTAGLTQLNAASFDSLVQLPGSLQSIINVGQPIGLAPYIIQPVDQRYKNDSNSQFGALAVQQPGACRVTGGGNDVDENLIVSNNANQAFPNSSTISYSFNKNNPNRYTYGGQVGAPSLLAPGPFGEWTHHQQSGQTDDFVFHAGTHSAPADTRINTVKCSDPGPCQPAAANAGFKQIDFEGTGSFRTLKRGGTVNGYPVVTDQDGGGTRHYFRVHIEDLGEPGSNGQKQKKCTHKPGTIIGSSGGVFTNTCSNCSDIYQIEIHATTDKNSPIIYTVGAYVDGGNLQIHPPVGQ